MTSGRDVRTETVTLTLQCHVPIRQDALELRVVLRVGEGCAGRFAILAGVEVGLDATDAEVHHP